MIGLISYADDEGYQQQNAESLAACVFGGSVTTDDIREHLAALEKLRLIDVTLDSTDTEFWLIHIINFLEHQYISRPQKSRIKARFHDISGKAESLLNEPVTSLNDDTPPAEPQSNDNHAPRHKTYAEDIDYVIHTLQNRCVKAEPVTHSMAGSILKLCELQQMHPDYVMSRVPSTHTRPFLYIKAALADPPPAERLAVPSEMRRTHSWSVFYSRQRQRGQPQMLSTVLAKMAGEK